MPKRKRGRPTADTALITLGGGCGAIGSARGSLVGPWLAWHPPSKVLVDWLLMPFNTASPSLLGIRLYALAALTMVTMKYCHLLT